MGRVRPLTQNDSRVELLYMVQQDISAIHRGMEVRQRHRLLRDVDRSEWMQKCSHCLYYFDTTSTGDGRRLTTTVHKDYAGHGGYVVALCKYEICEECYYDDLELANLKRHEWTVAHLVRTLTARCCTLCDQYYVLAGEYLEEVLSRGVGYLYVCQGCYMGPGR